MYILHSQQAYVKYLENESVKTLEGGLCQIFRHGNSNVLSEVHLCNGDQQSQNIRYTDLFFFLHWICYGISQRVYGVKMVPIS